jgi:alcohol dehydrogenase class IV
MTRPPAQKNFTWEDGERVIRFGRGARADVLELLDQPYTLLTTPRAAESAADVVEGAEAVHHVAGGRVDDLAGELTPKVGRTQLLVALGGGRVIDVAKALGGVHHANATRVAAIPTTLSAAEMTRIHRFARGFEDDSRPTRPAWVINDPDLSASQPTRDLAASSANALAHAIEAPLSIKASPVPTLAAGNSARLIADVWNRPEDPDAGGRERLALAALLSGYAIGAAHYGLSHVLSQTLVRIAGIGHGFANAAVLPVAIVALEARFPGRVDPDGELRALAATLARRAGAERLRDLGAPKQLLDDCAEEASGRAELALTPPVAELAELRALYEEAW